ncbi:peptidoglycan-binding domain-containing protein [Acetobacter okinawensis]|uniref:peptidoglycan-binding domain-containing protein n=1 Tax=Acetobacter okinawensis TaxID=1076594 RepID=UPI0004713DA9|nr:peptidoglycan-binding protein [Acetobacter okinawensis]
MGRKSSKPFWARDYRKAAYNRRYYLKKKMQDKLASIGIMAVGGTMFLGWLLPTHNPAYKPDIHVISTKTVQAAAASPTYASFTRNVYLPDFSCTVDHSKDSIATLLCENSDAARHELIFDQTYYALRQIVGKDGWKALRQEVLNDENTLAECIASPEVGNTLNIPKADPACYITHMDNLTDKYKARLSGSSLEEANRPIDEHITLQQNLIDLGFLKQNQGADGVYGEGTRSAILKWQQSNATLIADGFISDADAEKIAAMAENLPSLAAQQPPRINDANRAVFNPFSIPYKQNNNSIWPVLLLISLICGGIFSTEKYRERRHLMQQNLLFQQKYFGKN